MHRQSQLNTHARRRMDAGIQHSVFPGGHALIPIWMLLNFSQRATVSLDADADPRTCVVHNGECVRYRTVGSRHHAAAAAAAAGGVAVVIGTRFNPTCRA